MSDRRTVLGWVALGMAVLAGILLAGVLDAVFLAVIAGYAVLPLYRRLLDRGLSERVSGLIVSFTAFAAGILILAPFGIVLYLRRSVIVGFLRRLPAELAVIIGGFEIMIDLTIVRQTILPNVVDLAIPLARTLSIISLKLLVFGFIVYGIVTTHKPLEASLRDLLSPDLNEVATELHDQTRRLIRRRYAIPLIAASLVYLAALGVFWSLDYRIPFTLALIAALFRLLPIVSPALLVLGVAIVHLLVGSLFAAVQILIVGGLGIALIPRFVMTRWTGDLPVVLPTSLFLVGLVGGGLTAGVMGLVAGPLVILLVLTTLELLADQAPASPDD